MQNNDIQKILDRFAASRIGKANKFLLHQILNSRLIYQYDFEGNLIKTYKSLFLCAQAMNCGNRGIQSIIQGYDNVTNKPVYSKKGFMFRDKPTTFTKEGISISGMVKE